MPHRRAVDLRDEKPLLDVVSLGRPGPGRRDHFALGQIARTVRRAPEVVIKVSGGARTLRGLAMHLDYIGRKGDLEIETDDGKRMQEEGFEKKLIDDWDLDLESHREQSKWVERGRRPPKLVHNIIFSMPPGTPPSKLFSAVRRFAEDRFALQHRYAMVLHTDDDHPHVHVVVKAVSEQGKRLNIRKATLREWRQEFARNLREQGVPANATERAVRGQTRKPLKDGIYRAAARGVSSHLRDRVGAITRELACGEFRPGPGRDALQRIRAAVRNGWLAVGDRLAEDGHQDLAAEVRQFARQMPPLRTEREHIAAELMARATKARDLRPPTR
jgi:type IV secretory pathway VirD2 relaxase